jgi:cytochrome c-type biogenesis protein CcmH
MGNFAAAHAAQSRVIALRGDAASAVDYADLADLMILAAGGYVSPQAEAVLRQALERDPRNGAARYYLGLMYVQTGRPDLGFQIWRTLLAESTPQAPWVPPIRAQIQDVANLAGVRYRLPDAAAPAPGPSAADMAAAADMSADDRNQMIRNMVAGLGERLASEGGSPEEWARLITALGVLGEKDQAGEIWTEAQATFAADPGALDTIRAAALRAGVVQ